MSCVPGNVGAGGCVVGGPGGGAYDPGTYDRVGGPGGGIYNPGAYDTVGGRDELSVGEPKNCGGLGGGAKCVRIPTGG
jgi:hypothetical protein